MSKVFKREKDTEERERHEECLVVQDIFSFSHRVFQLKFPFCIPFQQKERCRRPLFSVRLSSQSLSLLCAPRFFVTKERNSFACLFLPVLYSRLILHPSCHPFLQQKVLFCLNLLLSSSSSCSDV